ncbi:MAG: GNAT family N-acetyltransferase [Sneathiella sp.]|nr:MAG: GNAT family N-acetyltransferase [Sneathiella sp.]
MDARPSHSSLTAPSAPHAIIRAENPTISFYRYLYDAVGRDWGWTDRKKISDADLNDIISSPSTEIYVLYIRGVPAGFAELNTASLPDVVDLAYFGFMPEFIGMKLGPYLLDWAIEEAWLKEPTRLTVNTCTLDHPKALPLYQRFGFQPLRQQEFEILPIESC